MSSPTYRLVQQLLRFVGEAAWLFAWSTVLGYWLDPRAGPALPLWLLGVLPPRQRRDRRRGQRTVRGQRGCRSPCRSSAWRPPSAPACSPPSLAVGDA